MSVSLIRSAARLQACPGLLRGNLWAVARNQNYTQLSRGQLLQNVQKFAVKPLPNVVKSVQRKMASGGDHRTIWSIERAVSLALAIALPACIAYPNKLFDNAVCILTVLHMHWGIEAVVVDYARPVILGHFIPKIAIASVYLYSAAMLGALLYFNYCDIGVGQLVREIWSIKVQPQQKSWASCHILFGK